MQQSLEERCRELEAKIRALEIENKRLAPAGEATGRSQAEEALQRAHDQLEQRVAERTAELRVINESLQREIVERKQMEEALRESEDKYRQLFELESDAIFLIDNESGQILEANTAASALYGYTHDELLSKKNTELSAEPDETRRVTETTPVIIEQVVYIALRFHRKKDGTVFPIEITGRFFTWRGRPVHIAAMRDITERRRAEEELRRTQDQLVQAQKMEAVGRLAGGIAHYFNNLLTAINGFAELMQVQLSPDDPLQELVDKILQSGQRAADLVRQLLAFSRKQIIEPQVLDLNGVVSDMDKMLRRFIGEDIELKISMAPDLWPVKVDPSQVGQVIVNLAVNARDAMPTGGCLTIETGNVITGHDYVSGHLEARPGEYVLLAISDTGIGMSRDVQAHLFEPFFTTKEVGRGTGLGLAIVYGIVKQSGGDVQVTSEEGVGTIFKIYLPRAAETVRTFASGPLHTDMPK